MQNGKFAGKDGAVEDEKPVGPAAQEEVQVGWMTEAKDWAGELISGQSTTGRILVRQRKPRVLIRCVAISFTDRLVL